MFKKKLITDCVLFMVFFQGIAQEGKLEKGKESLKKTSTIEHTSLNTRNTRRPSKRVGNNSFFNNFVAEVFINLFAYSAYGLAIESPFEKESQMRYAEISNFPYEKEFHGNYIYTDSLNYKTTRLDAYNRFLIENKNLYGNNLGLDFRLLKRVAFNLDYIYFVEKLSSGKDSFNMFSTLLKYHRIRTQRVDAWFGLGLTYIGNDVNRAGFTFGFGGEWFVKKPISILFSYKTASINFESVNNTKLLLKYHIKNYRISSGYEHFKLGVVKINAFSLGVEVSF